VLFFEIGLDDDSLEIPRCRRWGDTALDLFELGRGSTPASIAMVAIVVLSSETFLRCAFQFLVFGCEFFCCLLVFLACSKSKMMFLLFLLQQCLVQHIASEYKTFIKSIDQHVLNSCGVLVLYN
jgi:hypothetical protein